MLNKAIEKIKAEIDGSKNNPNIRAVGEFLLQHLALHNETAEKVLQEGKTIKSSIDEMKKVAKTKVVDGCGMLTDHEGFGIVLKYFGIEAAVSTVGVKIQEHVVQAPTAQEKKSFNVELDF
jgi:hypothetical protein